MEKERMVTIVPRGEENPIELIPWYVIAQSQPGLVAFESSPHGARKVTHIPWGYLSWGKHRQMIFSPKD